MGFLILFIIGICFLIGIVIYVASLYNNLVVLRNKVKNSWAHIDAQLQRRFDLIPNLVDIVKGFTTREEQLLGNAMATKGGYANAHTKKEKLVMNSQLNSILSSLYVMVESYPMLKSNVQFLQLQTSLTEIEEDITYARQFYNDAVTIYNNKLMAFPNNIIASMFNFKEETLFDALKEAELAPKIYYKIEQECPVCGAIVSGNRLDCEYCGTSMY